MDILCECNLKELWKAITAIICKYRILNAENKNLFQIRIPKYNINIT